jgi:hypothetical protein
MSGKLITAKIDVLKINKELLFKGEKGTYLDLTIWVNDTPDKFGNDISIEQRTKKGEDKIYLGNGKFYVPKDDGKIKPEDAKKTTVKSMSNIEDLPF